MGEKALYIDVSLNVPVDKAFTYKVPSASEVSPQAGERVEVLLSGRRMTGVIVGVRDSLNKNDVSPSKIKAARRIIDSKPLLTQELLHTARWMADYYLCSYGEVLTAMIPSGRREVSGPVQTAADDWGERCCLSEEQQNAVDGICSAARYDGHNANIKSLPSSAIYHYLYGPTGSGKTEVFLACSERVMKEGGGVIYLVPEIGLTPQVERAVRSRFGDSVALLHSALTGSERLNQWRRIMRGEARVVVGARSAIFAPVPQLGLIILDEEHDPSYKSGNTPRYHARQVAMHRAQMNGIPLVMGSATPSLESYQAVQNGTFTLHTLTRRLAGGAMPAIRTVDITKGGMETSCFSRTLVEEVRHTLHEKRQAILFLNRRGFTHFFRCMDCGFSLMCPNCSVPLTYHKAENRLRCHYCGYVTSPLEMCPKCGSYNIGYGGFGTEAVEAEARALFPNARIERADADSVSKAHPLEEVLSRFRRGECDILLGTQMVAKGLNFPRLSLVGVMLADTALHFPDFRAAERTFSLITQVAGRAGRYFPDGRVIVQTYNPDREVIRFAAASDIDGFYKWELNQRRITGFPPFSRLVHIVFRSTDEEAARLCSEEASSILRRALEGEDATQSSSEDDRAGIAAMAETQGEGFVLGPAECPLHKIAKNYRHQVLLTGNHIAPLRDATLIMLGQLRGKTGVYIEVDIDPVSML